MQGFCDPIVCYLGILAAISNTNCSVDVVLPPRPLDSDSSYSFLPQNKFFALTYFQKKLWLLRLTNFCNILKCFPW